MAELFGLWIQENFRNVPIPELPALFANVLALVNVQDIVLAGKREIEILAGPQSGHTRTRFRVAGLAGHGMFELHPGSVRPRIFAQVGVRQKIRGYTFGAHFCVTRIRGR
jgi:hypothetical protein